MAFLVSEAVSLTTAAGGGVTGFTTNIYTGYVLAILYTPDGTNPYSNSFVATVTGEQTTQAIWTETVATGNAALARFPRAATHTILGAAALYAAAGIAVLDYIPVVNERIKIVIASGGATKTGVFRVIIGP